jgi:hypothetical protein
MRTRMALLLIVSLAGCTSDSQPEATEKPASRDTKSAEPREAAKDSEEGAAHDEEELDDSKEWPSEATMSASTPLDEIPDNCKGFEVRGLEYSPGGDVLPNTCAPFDGTLNNPYAIRCIDANPDYKTKYAGDEYCILPPSPEQGVQIYVGPEDRNDAEQVEPFLLEPGKEINTYYYVNAPNADKHFIYRTNWRMRPGSHHMIISLPSADREDGWASQVEAGTDRGMAGMNFGGAQRTDVDRPQGTLDVPPENSGLGLELAAKQQFSFNLHHINTGDEPILREAWVNAWYKDASEVTQPMQGISIFGNPADVAIDPGVHAELHYKCDVQEQTRIVSLIGHRHANTDRFGIWLERDGKKTDVYESFEYTDMPTYQYDSISMNPVPDVENKVDGGYSGMLELEPGDELHFVCDITNRQDTRLRFANELLTGEMCIVFGSRVGGEVCGRATRVMD